MAIAIPNSLGEISRVVDCMELNCCLSGNSVFRLDEIENELEISQDEEFVDVGANDAQSEDFRSQVGVEVDRRSRALKQAYPFAISRNGEELKFSFDDNLGQISYLLSLLIHNSWPNGLLTGPHKLTDPEFVTARRAFEILAAVAAAGYAIGPSFHIGRNRGGAQNLLAHLRSAWIIVGDGSIRQAPIDDAPRHANDDGVDVISFRPSQSGVPHQSIVFVQSAAGRDWKNKSVKGIVDRFLRNWFEVPPVSPKEYLMIVADLPDRNTNFQSTQELGFIAHRLEAPFHVYRANEMQLGGNLEFDCHAQIHIPRDWVQAYIAARRQIQ